MLHFVTGKVNQYDETLLSLHVVDSGMYTSSAVLTLPRMSCNSM